MKWLAILAGAIASGLVTCAASADVRMSVTRGARFPRMSRNSPRSAYSGQRIVVDGPCLSACTLFTGIVPRDRVCITRRAALGFHAASYYNDASRSLVPTRQGSALVMRLYPPSIRSWINRHGGLRPQMIVMRSPELSALYPICQ